LGSELLVRFIVKRGVKGSCKETGFGIRHWEGGRGGFPYLPYDEFFAVGVKNFFSMKSVKGIGGILTCYLGKNIYLKRVHFPPGCTLQNLLTS